MAMGMAMATLMVDLMVEMAICDDGLARNPET